MELVLTARSCGDFTVVVACGDIDAATSDRLASFLADARRRDTRGIILDLSQVGFMDCSGLRVLVSAQRDAALLGGELRLAATKPAVSKVLGLSDVYRVLPPFPTVAAAKSCPSAIRIVNDTVPFLQEGS